MRFEAWPFLISRNKTLDYRVVVAPGSLVKDDTSSLIELTGGEYGERDQIQWREMENSVGKNLKVVFRVEYAESYGSYVRDGFGRVVLWVVGFVSQDNIRELSVSEDVFAKVREAVRSSYSDFLYQTVRTSASSSEPLSLEIESQQISLPSSESLHSIGMRHESESSFSRMLKDLWIKLIRLFN